VGEAKNLTSLTENSPALKCQAGCPLKQNTV
jgi:hypothetical protein